MQKDLNEILDKSSTISEILNAIQFLNNISENFFCKNQEFLIDCFKKFSNLYIVSPDYLKEDKDYMKAAITVTASNILFVPRKLSFEELKEFVKVNPFVSTYSIEFLSQREQALLFLEAFKNTGKSCFFFDIKDESLREQILFDIYFKKINIENDLSKDFLEEIDRFISSFEKEELEDIFNLKYN